MINKNKAIDNVRKTQIISMLETVKESLILVNLKSETILIDEIIDNINDSMFENDIKDSMKKQFEAEKLKAVLFKNGPKSIDNIPDNDSIIINNNSGQINNVNRHGSINVSQTTNVKHKRFISNDYKYISED